MAGACSSPRGWDWDYGGGVMMTAKMAAADFQEAKKQLFEAFKKAELGSWIKKPMEQDEFMSDE